MQVLTTDGDTVELENFRSIASFHLPPNWTQADSAESRGYTVQEFRRQDDRIVLACMVRKASAGSAVTKNLSALLAQPPHHLSASEAGNLHSVLHQKSMPDSFEIASLETVDLNGQTVLRCQGKFLDSGDQCLSIFVGVAETDSGTFVEEIAYEAPAERFDAYWPEVSAAFQTIKWS